jgi:hypothetical protein
MQRKADGQLLLLLLLFRSGWIESQILIVTQPKATIKNKGLRWKKASIPSPACELQWQLMTNDEADRHTEWTALLIAPAINTVLLQGPEYFYWLLSMTSG